jgi:hypothetical protein
VTFNRRLRHLGIGKPTAKSPQSLYWADCITSISGPHDGPLFCAHRLSLERHCSEPSPGALCRHFAPHTYAWAWRLLQTIPGIDEIGGALILIEIGDDMPRFGSPSRLASWTALCPGDHESAGKRKSGKTRHGNPIVRYLLWDAANAARENVGAPIWAPSCRCSTVTPGSRSAALSPTITGKGLKSLTSIAETMLASLWRSLLIRGFINTEFVGYHHESFLKELSPFE